MDLWNSVKREICPNGLDINIENALNLFRRKFGKDEDEEEHSQYSDDSYGHFYYNDYGTFDKLFDDDIETTEESTEGPDESIPIDSEITIQRFTGNFCFSVFGGT